MNSAPPENDILLLLFAFFPIILFTDDSSDHNHFDHQSQLVESYGPEIFLMNLNNVKTL